MRHASRTLTLALSLATASSLLPSAAAAEMPAVVHKRTVDVHAAPDLAAPRVATLARDTRVAISAQQGLWYRLLLADGGSGFVRVNDVRMAYAGTETPDANSRALFGGNAGQGRVTETASVRGIDESDLRSAAYDSAGMARLDAQRVDVTTAAAHARTQGWQARKVAYPDEAAELVADGAPQATQAEKRSGLSAARGLLSRVGGGIANIPAARVADRAIGKSDREIAAEELALGPAVAGRVLGAAPLWKDQDAQRRVNMIGRWLASQTSRPDLPWTFGIIDDGEVNAFAAPGGYILLTRGLYQLLVDDAEVAAVIAHELAHVVQRDHFEVIRRQQVREAGKDVALAQVHAPGAAGYAKAYVDRHGAGVLLTSLDRGAEFHADKAAGIYLERAGFEPLAYYAVLQKMTALGTRPARLAQLYRSHPPLDERLDRLDAGQDRGRRR